MGGRDQKMATPPPPPVMVKVQVFFVEKFFFAYNPLKRKKKLSDLKVKFLPPPPPNLNYAKFFHLMKATKREWTHVWVGGGMNIGIETIENGLYMCAVYIVDPPTKNFLSTNSNPLKTKTM